MTERMRMDGPRDRAAMRMAYACVVASILCSGALAVPCVPAWTQPFDWRTGPSGQVFAMTVFDDGSGSGRALYAGGAFGLRKWDGTSWSSLDSGVNGTVRALLAFDDGLGGGPALYVGGDFSNAGGVPASCIAKWNGASWSALDSGMSGTYGDLGGNLGTHPTVFALAVFDDGLGAGPALYAGGEFITAGGVNASGIAKWNGTTWSALQNGVLTASVFGVLPSYVAALAVVDDHRIGGPALFVGGQFASASGMVVNNIAMWTGTSWSALGTGIGGSLDDAVLALEVFDGGTEGIGLYAGGWFFNAGDVAANHIAKWDGESWSPLGTGVDFWVASLESFDDGTGPALHVGGAFSTAGGVATNGTGKWNGSTWSALGGGLNGVPYVLTSFDDGSATGPALYAGGWFDFEKPPGGAIAKWQSCAGDGMAGDLNGDGIVDGADLGVLLNNWGGDGVGDLNGDGIVDGADLGLLLNNWG